MHDVVKVLITIHHYHFRIHLNYTFSYFVRTQEETNQTTISNTIDVPRANDILPIPETSEQGHVIPVSTPSSLSDSDNSDNESSTEMTQVVPYGMFYMSFMIGRSKSDGKMFINTDEYICYNNSYIKIDTF